MNITALTTNGLIRFVGKTLLSLVLVIFLSFAITHNANAQDYEKELDENSYSTSNTFNSASNVELNSGNAIQILFINFLSAVSCQLGGYDPANPGGKCLGVNSETGEIGFVENGGGAIMVVASLIDATFTPPASSIQYMSYLKSNFGIVKDTHAQEASPNSCMSNNRGVGFCALEPLLPVWVAMRNIVYLLFIVVFIIIGMGIMLRLHIDPRTVMTIQNQIPKIIVGILAVTFSFAIAGFLIDIMFVAIFLFANVVITATGFPAAAALDITQATDPFQAINAGWTGAVNNSAELPIYDIANGVASAFAAIIVKTLESLQKDLGIIWNVIGGAISIIGTIIVFFAILIVLIRFLITLIFAFVNIILDVIFAPWWILAGLIPGSPLGLGAWLRDLIANLAVFPVSIGFILLGSYLMGVFYNDENTISSNFTFPLLGSTNSNIVAALIGFGFILMLPNLLKTLKAALKTQGMNFGNLAGPVGSASGFVFGVPRSVIQTRNEARTPYAKYDPTAPQKITYEKTGLTKAFTGRMFGKK